MDAKKVEELVEKTLSQPKEIEVDGQRVTNQSLSDILKTASYFASKEATSGKRSPLRFTRMKSGGAIC